MDEPTPVEGAIKTEPPHRKPRHLAEKVESYMVRAMGVGAALLLVFLLYSFMKTGSGVPSWMH